MTRRWYEDYRARCRVFDCTEAVERPLASKIENLGHDVARDFPLEHLTKLNAANLRRQYHVIFAWHADTKDLRIAKGFIMLLQIVILTHGRQSHLTGAEAHDPGRPTLTVMVLSPFLNV